MEVTTQALRYHSFGSPQKVLQLESFSLPLLRENQVQLDIEAAAINPSDYGRIAGSYGHLAELPAVAGREGVGRVVRIGSAVKYFSLGDRVRLPSEIGSWQTCCIVEAADLMKVPKTLPVDQAAMAFINPSTAWLLLQNIIPLEKGDWIVQNGANSALGLLIIQLAHKRGLHTLNIVRRKELIPELEAYGADKVVTEDDAYWEEDNAIIDGKRPRLAINSIGGKSAVNLIKCLADEGVHVTVGGMARESVYFPTRHLIFRGIQLRGFWLDVWMRRAKRDAINEVFSSVFELMLAGWKVPVAQVYSLSDWEQALDHALRPRLGKVLFHPQSS